MGYDEKRLTRLMYGGTVTRPIESFRRDSHRTFHPGGSVSGGPGGNAAAVMLKDFGTSIEEVVKGRG